MRTANSTTHWRVALYAWDATHPKEGELGTSLKYNVDFGIQSITVNRSKTDPNASTSIVVRGTPASHWMAGNWAVIYTSNQPFTAAEPFGGTPLFIGQITHISTQLVKEENGILAQVTQVTLRPWSSLLQTPIIYDIFGIMQTYRTDQAILGTLGAYTTNTDSSPYTKIAEVHKDIFNPWRYAVVALSFIGAVSEKTKSAVLDQMRKYNITPGGAEEIAADHQEVATKLPKIPSQMLSDLNFPSSVTSDNAFKAEDGFMALLLGVQTGDNKFAMTDGAFDSLEALTGLYEPTGDRPILSNVGPEFAESMSAWNLIQQRADRDGSNEMFADIWYYREGERILPRPVFVLRDKQNMLAKLKKNMPLISKWSVYDEVPVTDIDDVYIKRVSLTNTFFNSPNYTTCRFNSPSIRANSNISHEAFRLSRVKSTPEMNRFGGIAHTYNTPYTAQSSLDLKTGNTQVGLDWYKDLAYVQWAWNNNDYRMWHGSFSLIDPSVPISVGLNIRFKLGKFVCVAEVTGVTYQHQVLADGLKRTDCSVKFRNLVVERSDGKYEFPGAQFHAQINSSFFEKREDIEGEVVNVPFSTYADAANGADAEKDGDFLKLEGVPF